MPAKSKAQFRFMAAAAHGKVKGISPKIGKEFVHKTSSYKSLPARKGK